MSFEVRLLISFVLATTYVATVGLVAERLNSQLAGVIAGMPSVLLISIVFITLGEGWEVGADAAFAGTISFSAAGILATTFAALVNRGALFSYLIAITPWFVIAAIGINVRSFGPAPTLLAIPFVTLAVTISRRSPCRPTQLHLERPIWLLLVQGILAGIVIGVAIVTAKQLGGGWGGIVSGFPVIISTSMIFFWAHHHNRDALVRFASGVPRGTITSILFALVYGGLLHVAHNTWISLAVGYVVALAAALTLVKFNLFAGAKPLEESPLLSD